MPGLLDQQKKASEGNRATEQPKAAQSQPELKKETDLTGLEEMLKTAATSPSNMANSRKGNKSEEDDPSDVTGKSDEELGLVKYAEEDYKLAEDVVFKGFATREYAFGRDSKFKAVLTTTTANEELIIDELMSDFATNSISQQNFQHYMAIVMLSLSLQSLNGKDFPENPRLSLSLLKSALKKLLEFERDGEIKKFGEQHDAIIKLVKARISYIKTLPTPVLDILAKKRSALETMVIKLLEGGILKN